MNSVMSMIPHIYFEHFALNNSHCLFMLIILFDDEVFSNLSIICSSPTLFALDFHFSSNLSLYVMDYETGAGFFDENFLFLSEVLFQSLEVSHCSFITVANNCLIMNSKTVDIRDFIKLHLCSTALH